MSREHNVSPAEPANSPFEVKRIYDPPSNSDGLRILVDRLWPRGITREKARLDHWLAAIAPSNELRRAFGHDPKKWDWFCSSYLEELKDEAELCAKLLSFADEQKVTLLFAAKDEAHNNAVVLKSLLDRLRSYKTASPAS